MIDGPSIVRLRPEEVRALNAELHPLRVHRHECFVLLGHNGAGKSTTISAISGLIKPSAGSIEMFGAD